ncbi:MAG: hypothetical protein GYA55_12115 [SAR324 cluster bacterium]|uniref:Uncharacterized protein n=1 Tax=SAR324 cluster bacterium TaxID=2024889 RepID=A0A7X9IL90_9DELT|nr:hypothetical protein [SAR324 cluster bacterium]
MINFIRKQCKYLLVWGLIITGMPNPILAESILGGVARTIEDIGGQIVGNPAAKNNDKLERQMMQGQGYQGVQGNIMVIEAKPTVSVIPEREAQPKKIYKKEATPVAVEISTP